MPRRARRKSRGTSRGTKMPNYSLFALAGGIVLFLLLVDRVSWPPYLTWLVAWSVTAFVFYGLDKSCAVNGAWRVPEMVLHLLALIGGVAGCWAGMLLFRHKTQHGEFKLTLIVATIIHGAIALSLVR